MARLQNLGLGPEVRVRIVAEQLCVPDVSLQHRV